jgi:PleD family two-component response regulator
LATDDDAADHLIAGASLALRAVVRESGFIARLGTEEFGILLADVDFPAARNKVHQLRLSFRAAGIIALIGLAARDASNGLRAAWASADRSRLNA